MGDVVKDAADVGAQTVMDTTRTVTDTVTTAMDTGEDPNPFLHFGKVGATLASGAANTTANTVTGAGRVLVSAATDISRADLGGFGHNVPGGNGGRSRVV